MKTKQIQSTFHITPRSIEIAKAWANDKISIGTVKEELGVANNNKAYSVLSRSLKQYIIDNKL